MRDNKVDKRFFNSALRIRIMCGISEAVAVA